MAKVLSQARLEAAYAAASSLIKSGKMPSALLSADQRLYRIIDPTRDYSKLTKPAPDGFVSKQEGFQLMIPVDGSDSFPDTHPINANRFSGPSGSRLIPSAAGFYLSLQQQALMNETMHYANFSPHEPSALQIEHTSGRNTLNNNGPLAGKCILQFRVLGTMLVADLSPHNPGTMAAFQAMGKDTWKEVQSSDDCSVARGIGLAVANSGVFSGLIVRTVRGKGQSGKSGDNVVLYTSPGRQIQRISLEKATFYDMADGVETFPSAFVPGLSGKGR